MKFIKSASILLAICFLVLSSITVAQTHDSRNKQNQLYLELGGNAVLYSFNYERILPDNFTLRAGISYLPGLIIVEGTFFLIPVSGSYLIGSESSKLEIGLGATLFTGTDVEIFGYDGTAETLIFLTGIVGYRYISQGGFVFRVAFTPYYHSDADPEFIPSAGLSFGFLF